MTFNKTKEDLMDMNDNFFTRQAAKLAKNIFIPDKKPLKTGAKKKENDKKIVKENNGGTNPSAQALKNKKKKLRRKAKKERAKQQ